MMTQQHRITTWLWSTSSRNSQSLVKTNSICQGKAMPASMCLLQPLKSSTRTSWMRRLPRSTSRASWLATLALIRDNAMSQLMEACVEMECPSSNMNSCIITITSPTQSTKPSRPPAFSTIPQLHAKISDKQLTRSLIKPQQSSITSISLVIINIFLSLLSQRLCKVSEKVRKNHTKLVMI